MRYGHKCIWWFRLCNNDAKSRGATQSGNRRTKKNVHPWQTRRTIVFICVFSRLAISIISPLKPIKTSIPTDGDEHSCILVFSQSCIFCNHSAAGIAMSLHIYLPVSLCLSVSSQDKDYVLLIFALSLVQGLTLRPRRKQNSQNRERKMCIGERDHVHLKGRKQ